MNLNEKFDRDYNLPALLKEHSLQIDQKKDEEGLYPATNYRVITIGLVRYKVLGIFKDENDVWHFALLSISNGQWVSVQTAFTSMEWINCHAHVAEFYQEKLKNLPEFKLS